MRKKTTLYTFKNWWVWLFACLLPACEKPASDAQKALSTFEIADGFKLELVAAEPMIADPVDMEIDAKGRLYVVEMHGYPLDKGGSGIIKILEDTDQDGYPDKSHIFADSLVLPTGITSWKNGVIVTDAPDVLYLEDTDGDFKADVREVLLTGFALSNPQHNLNNPVYGLDNWIYLAHEGAITPKVYTEDFGDTGQQISFPNKPDAPRLPMNANGRNVRFRPGTYELEALSGETQFGQTFDEWGHHVLNSNAHHLFHEVIAARYLDRNYNLYVPDATAYMPDYGQGVEVFPITQNPEHQLLTDVGVITSACGVTWYLADLFPAQYQQVTFVAEPVHNLVHTDRIARQGSKLIASRQFNEKEFLASTDSWFRPVNFYIGPSGSLYLLDYYRQMIEHPEWMSEEAINSGMLYNGIDQGRVYRILPENSQVAEIPAKWPADHTDEELAHLLSHPNIWWRRHAQRLLMERQSQSAVPVLQKMVEEAENPFGRLHAIWTLEGLGALSAEEITSALQDDSPGVRENAIRLAEIHLGKAAGLGAQLLTMAEDPDPAVRFQLLLTLGFVEGAAAAEMREKLLFQDIADEWVHIAALSAAPGEEFRLFEKAVAAVGSEESPGALAFFQKAAEVIGTGAKPEAVNRLVNLARQQRGENAWWTAASLRGLARGLEGRAGKGEQWAQSRQSLLALFGPNTDPALRRAALQLLETLGTPNNLPSTLVAKAQTYAFDHEKPPALREDAIFMLQMAGPVPFEQDLKKLVSPQEPIALQKAAVKALSCTDDDRVCRFLLDNWANLTPGLREDAVGTFLENDDRMWLLLSALEEGKVPASAVSWRRTVHLMNYRNVKIRDKARTLLAGDPEARKKILGSYQEALTLSGDLVAGEAVFEKACSQCHQFSGEKGISYGPDLSTVRNRDKTAIMADILEPSRSIADGYELWEVTLTNGDLMFGIISSETASTVTLRDASGGDRIVARKDIASMKASPISAMTEGLEKQVSVQEMADLLAYLKQIRS